MREFIRCQENLFVADFKLGAIFQLLWALQMEKDDKGSTLIRIGVSG